MLALERRRKIAELVLKNKSVIVLELSKTFNVTEETIRRDLERLEKEGLLRRTYGGAILNDNTNLDVPLDIREVTNIECKKLISIRVSEFIQDGDSVILDASSTTLQVAKLIKNKSNITVLTNSQKVISELADARDCKIISTGGNLKVNSMSLIGSLTIKAIKNYNADKAIISCKGIHIEKGICDSNEGEAEVKKAMITSADKVFLLVDHDKFDKVSFVSVTDFNKIDKIFTDKTLSDDWEKLMKKSNVEIIYSE